MLLGPVQIGQISRLATMRLLLGTVLAACLLGIAVDLVTAHVAVEYFTVHHPHLIDSQEPLPIAFAWGVAASWWFGAIAGGVLLVARRFLTNPPPDRWILGKVGIACASIWAMMMLVLLSIYAFAGLIPANQRRPSFEHDRRLMAVAIAHMGEYVFGAIAIVMVLVAMARYSRRGATQPSDEARDAPANARKG